MCACKDNGSISGRVDKQATQPSPESPEKAKSAMDLINANKGSIQVLLLGMPSCPGTNEGTPKLTAYSKTAPDGVFVARLDIPPQGKTLNAKPDGLDPALSYAIDSDQKVAETLEFFFYPTLFILDKDLKVRYHGDADFDNVSIMVDEMIKENPSKPGKIYTVEYENLVSNQEDVTRDLLKHCGLPWNDACLNFQKNTRAVLTSSSIQVRQALYTESIDRWKAYENYLGPLLKLSND